MTTDPNDDRIDSETLAAFVDGRLSAAERAAVEAKLASDDDSYELLVELMRTEDALPEPQVQSGRQWWWAAGAVAAAATIVLAVRFIPTSPSGSPTDTRIEALVAAVNGERYVEPRLTGGFPSGPVRSVTRGSADPSNRGTGDLSSQNLALLAAVGEAQKRSLADPSAANLHAWGIGLVLLGSLDQAIDTLESASANAPEDSTILSDLAAAYAARAAGVQSARDWSNALDRSERALRLDPALVEAAFNRALALEALNLDGALVAWRTYLDLDRSSEWSNEARDRLAKLSAKPQGSRRRENEAAIRAALDNGSDAGALERAVRLDPQRSREWIEEDLAREWAAAVIANDRTRELRAREKGQRLIAAYGAVANDALPREALEHAWSRAADRAQVAAALVQYADAAQLVRDDRVAEASSSLSKALLVLQSSNSPLSWWARYYVALAWSQQQARIGDALAELNRIEAAIEPAKYPVLAATVMNRRGAIFGRQGDQELAIRERLRGIPLSEHAADLDQVALFHSMIAEAYRLLGDTSTAWQHHDESLKRLTAAPNYRSRHLVLVQAGLTAAAEGHFDAANAFQRQVVENGREWQRPSGISSGLLQLAVNLARSGQLDQADESIREARAVAADVADTSLRNLLEFELLGVEGELFGSREPAAGLPVLSRAVDGFSQRGFAVRLSNLLLWRGRLHVRAGDSSAAESDWQRAVESLERERTTVSAESLRLAQAGSLRTIQSEMAFARLHSKRSAADSLEPIERGRARTLVENALGGVAPAALDTWRGQLDADTAVIHYAIGAADAAAWVTTNEGVTVTPLAITSPTLAILIDRDRFSERGGSVAAQSASSRELYRALITPLSPLIDQRSSLIIVPDPALAGVSFGALVNPSTGAYLVESKNIAMAPSGALLAESGSAPKRGRALLVAADRPDGFPALPWAKEEVARLSAVYAGATVLTGADATRERLLAEAPHAAVIHFAGHAFSNPMNPLLSRLLLHRGADGRSELYAYELSSLDVSGAVVVLAACRTGYTGVAGADDDGVLAMARPFLARGARAVLATYRDVADSGAANLMASFHKHLNEGASPAMAWQTTALTALAQPTPSREWKAYAVFLGRGSLGATPSRRMTDDMSGGR